MANAARRLLAALVWLLPLTTAAAPAIDATRSWLVRSLAAELERPTPDLNHVSSLVFPLSTDWRRAPTPPVEAALRRAWTVVGALEPARLACGDLSDRFLIQAFLHEAGLAPATPHEPRLADCLSGDDPFARANLLLMSCRYGAAVPPERRDAARRALLATQNLDGGFAVERGAPSGYYLSSHAILALHYCGADPQAVRVGGFYLLDTLLPFADQGYLDGLAESLIFLRWMGVEIPWEERYYAFLFERARADGGLCFVEQEGCQSHWHATALLLETLHLWQEVRSSGL